MAEVVLGITPRLGRRLRTPRPSQLRAGRRLPALDHASAGAEAPYASSKSTAGRSPVAGGEARRGRRWPTGWAARRCGKDGGLTVVILDVRSISDRRIP